MMLLAILLGLLLIRPAGGSYRALAGVRIRWGGLFLIGTAVQMILAPLLDGREVRVGPTVAWLVGAGVLVLACVANRTRPGFVVAALGVGLNVLVIAANVGMPVHAAALDAAGASPAFAIQSGTIYHIADDATRMLILADVVPIPGPPGIRSVASLGDLLIGVGVVVAILHMAVFRENGTGEPLAQHSHYE